MLLRLFLFPVSLRHAACDGRQVEKRMEDFLPLLGKRLRALRQKKGVTQERAAELMKVTPKHMGEIERGLATPSLPLLSKLAELHGLSLS